MCYDGETFTKEFIVKDDESSKDIIEGFIYQYNKTKMCLDEMCCNTYHILKSEKNLINNLLSYQVYHLQNFSSCGKLK